MTKRELRDIAFDYREAFTALSLIRCNANHTPEQLYKARDRAWETLRKLEKAIASLDLPNGDD